MVKSKIVAVTAAAAMVAALGLTACAGQSPSSSSASNTSASSSATTSSSATSPSASSASASASSASAEETLVSWQGALTDGTIVDYISSDDGKNGGLVLTKIDANGKEDATRWLGAMKVTDEGTVTITDDETNKSVTFKLVDITKDGAVKIDVEGYGKGVLVPMSAADWARLAEAEAMAEVLAAKTNSVCVFEDGTLLLYTENEEGTDAFAAVLEKGATEPKVWMGKATTAADGTETITDDKSGEKFSYKWSQDKDSEVLTIEHDKYGKGAGVEMSVGDWLVLDELANEMQGSKPAKTTTSTSNTANTASSTASK